MQTFIDRYIEQGRQQGIEQGIEKGIEKGIEQGEANVLLHLITKKFGPPSESVRQRIAAADADTLLHWSERILTADSLEAMLH
jgi:flagellar biosynthesis/type III secretory pathway protein FliH